MYFLSSHFVWDFRIVSGCAESTDGAGLSNVGARAHVLSATSESTAQNSPEECEKIVGTLILISDCMAQLPKNGPRQYLQKPADFLVKSQ